MSFLINRVSAFIILISILVAVFVNYPEPPLSPFLNDWYVSGHTFNFKGFQIFYKDEITTNKNDITVVILHGFPTSSIDFYKVWPELRQNVDRIIAPDFLGFGFSDKPRSHFYSINEQSDMIEKLLTHLNVKKVHIFAHDYGDTVAQELMARQIEGNLSFAIESVCLMNGGIFPSVHKRVLSQKILRTKILGPIVSKFINSYSFKKSMSGVFGSKTQPTDEEYNDMWTLIRRQNGYLSLVDILYYIDERFQNEERWVGALKSDKIKLHFIYGPSDPLNSSPIFPTTYMKTIPNPSLDTLDEDISHYPQIESPKRVIQSYINWLKLNKFLRK